MKKYEMRPCPHCGGTPSLYGEGLGKIVFEDEWHFYFTDFDGYIVQCEDCEKITKHHADPKDAVEEWNTDESY